MPSEEMNTQEAVNLIAQVVAQVSAPLAQHEQMQAAMQVIVTALNEKAAPVVPELSANGNSEIVEKESIQ